jgi:tetratricopeptide (TPR) repeat protein
LALLEPLIHTGDLDEPTAQHWITALIAAGRVDEARSFITAFRRRFRREMGVQPDVRLPSRQSRGDAPVEPSRPAPEPVPVPAPRAPAGPDLHRPVGPRQLPKDIGDFTGQREVLAELDRLVDPANRRTNVVVVSGMPGVGKTTLAVHWAHRVMDRFPDGQLYLNANGYGPTPGVQPEDALGRFLHSLGAPPDRIPPGVRDPREVEASIEERRDRLNRTLAGRRVLILVDNVRDAHQVRPLLTTSATCVTVITSRTRLTELSIREGVPNLTVSPLREDESLALLGRMVGSSRAAGEPAALRRLARLSDGLPLALRIIGVHVAQWPLAGIADLVDELGGRLLDGDADDGEASLRTAFAWSYAALPADAARVFRLLGFHPGLTVSPAAAAALAGVGLRPAERMLNVLAKAHLLNHDTARRYRFHDVTRRYAADRAYAEEPAAELRRAARRALDWYLLSAAAATASLASHRPPVPELPLDVDVEPQSFTTDTEALKWYEEERENIVAMTRWAVVHQFYRHAWQLPGVVHEVFDRYGQQDDVVELLELAQTAAGADGHQQGQVGILINLGATYFALHHYDRAAEHFRAALDLAREIGFGEAELTCVHNLATVLVKTGDVAAAVRSFRWVLDVRRAAGESEGEAHALQRLGQAHRLLGEHARAEEHYRGALAIWERIGSLRGQGATHAELAALFLGTGQLDAALAHCRRAVDINRRTRDEVALCDVLTTMADVHRERCEPAEAVAVGRRAVALCERIEDPLRHGRALIVLAGALAVSGQKALARELCDQARALVDDVADPDARLVRERLAALAGTLAPLAG